MKNPFEFHGVEILEEDDRKWKGTCFMCGKEAHWAGFKDTLQWKCVRCGEAGNLYTFLKNLHRISRQETNAAQYATLAEHRTLTVDAIKKFRLCKSALTDEWLIPTFARDKKNRNTIVNLHRYVETAKGIQLMGTPTLKQRLFNAHTVRSNDKPLLVVEGHWDCIATDLAISSSPGEEDGTLRDKYELVAAPGANTFPANELTILSGREVTILFDNDQAGQDGVKNIVRKAAELQQPPTSIRQIVWADDNLWEDGCPKGHDIRDLLGDFL